jgi:HEAT repeat protein
MNENLDYATASSEACQPGELEGRALKVLLDSLLNPSPYVRLHGAESLVEFGFAAAVLPIFEQALPTDGELPGRRICIWRVLARAKRTATERAQHVDQLCTVCLSPDNPDAASATESLAKLGYRIDAAHRGRYVRATECLSGAATPHGRWLLAVSGNREDLERLADLLDCADPSVRGVAAYALRHLHERLADDTVNKIAAAAIAESHPTGRKYLVSAAFVTDTESGRLSAFKSALLDYLRSGTNDEKYEAATALGIRGIAQDLDMLARLLHDTDADVRVAASTAVLRILIRAGQSALPSAPHAVA